MAKVVAVGRRRAIGMMASSTSMMLCSNCASEGMRLRKTCVASNSSPNGTVCAMGSVSDTFVTKWLCSVRTEGLQGWEW